MNNLKTEGLQISYDKRVIVDALNIEIPTGKITALVGANGSGKSTILKTMSRLMKPSKGNVFLDGKAIHRQSTKEIAKQLAILPQNPTAPDGLTVTELVSYGRSPHQSGLKSMSAKDHDMIQWAIRVTSMTDFADRSIDSLSGGQRQRAWIAMALAQETGILFLDEPTTFLDMTHQLEVLMLLKQLNLQENRTIVMVVHDLNHASRFADHMIAIRSGQVIAEGSPVNVMTEQTLEDVFGIKADIMLDPRTGVPLCLPYETCQACEIRQVATKLAGEVVVKLV
ncbi:ABC transporter ATP-binding protein [Paenilisteria rocourtiae]|uniref:Iron complex transport system ATP-binding protein n=1 Tax=Listeria rocourtiae TaxID=647910 RepID=A0A4R6ZRP5_9LIST|nr:ABC transporter ATP-binding protein [Listeria rocourtiae]EUJ45193.1 iron ABC transporter ATP-binding protein [Listeria rocourtiae FSL F6-920]MBC1434672.1 ABC transporter ATP-binding protein [Listeria rocourtiae]MBC1603364.1 ABC transporter ATP-binding protein [Listeria rocourtiae]TDR55351.1 iron complex transport system ATP-binding protein [Listeria rocourtiae]